MLENATVNSDTYQPFIAIRKKKIFNNRTNSVKSRFVKLSINTTQKIYWFISFGDTITNTDWTDIEGIPTSETSLEKNNNVAIANTTQFKVIDRDVVDTGNSKSSTQTVETRVTLGQEDPIVLWVKKTTGGTDSTIDAILNFQEEW